MRFADEGGEREWVPEGDGMVAVARLVVRRRVEWGRERG
jgi:hypothetical protein